MVSMFAVTKTTTRVYGFSGVTLFKKVLPFQIDDLWQMGNRNVLYTATMNVVPLGANDTNDRSK